MQSHLAYVNVFFKYPQDNNFLSTIFQLQFKLVPETSDGSEIPLQINLFFITFFFQKKAAFFLNVQSELWRENTLIEKIRLSS